MFGLKYTCEFKSAYKSILWRVEISEADYSGAIYRMTASEKPLTIEWGSKNQEFFEPVKGSEVTLRVLCKNNFEYIDLFTSDPRRFRMTIYRNGILFWRGYLTADTYSETFAPPPYDVSIAAIDGFSLLTDLPYVDSTGRQFTGQKSLATLLQECMTVLDLDLETSDWLDLYTLGSDEQQSSLDQVQIDMDRVYMVYAEASYRDMLEMCLRPFGAQIFQAIGAIHIRRIVSLKQPYRPVSYFNGRPNRPVFQDTWEKGTNVLESCDLAITPAVRTLNIEVKNGRLENLVGELGWLDPAQWTEGWVYLSRSNKIAIRTRKTDGWVTISHRGYPLKQSSDGMKIKFGLLGPNDSTLRLEFKLVSSNKTYWFSKDSVWTETKSYFTLSDTRESGNERELEIQLPNIPSDGDLVLVANCDFSGASEHYDRQNIVLGPFEISMDSDSDDDKYLSYHRVVNNLMNQDIDIEIPLGDIPSKPNASLAYPLYLTSLNGEPTRQWHTRSQQDYGSLIQHLADNAIAFRSSPSWTISGPIFTARMLDLNTIFEDKLYTRRIYYTNALSLDASEDEYDVELIEINRNDSETPEPGDDCVKRTELPEAAARCIRCEQYLIIMGESGAFYRYDSYGRTSVRLPFVARNFIGLYNGENCFVVVEADIIRAVNYNGDVIYSQANQWQTIVATYDRKGLTYDVVQTGRKLIVAGAPSDGGYRRGAAENRSDNSFYINGTPLSLVRTDYEIIVNTDVCSYHWDIRVNAYGLSVFAYDASVLSSSDRMILTRESSAVKIYARNSLTINDCTLLATDGGGWWKADQNVYLAAYCSPIDCKLFNSSDGSFTTIKNNQGIGSQLVACFFVGGELLIVRRQAIYKYVGESSPAESFEVNPSSWENLGSAADSFSFLKAGEAYQFTSPNDYMIVIPSSLSDHIEISEKKTSGFTVRVTEQPVRKTDGNILVREVSTGMTTVLNYAFIPQALLAVDPDTLTFDKESGELEVDVVSNTGWTANVSGDWCALSVESGGGFGNGKIRIAAQQNPTGYIRNARVTVSDGVSNVLVPVYQLAQAIYVHTDAQEYYYSDKAQDAFFYVDSNVTISASGNQSWCRVSVSKPGERFAIQIRLSRNETAASRESEITIDASGVLKTITIIQDGSISSMTTWIKETFAKLVGGNKFTGNQEVDGDVSVSGQIKSFDFFPKTGPGTGKGFGVYKDAFGNSVLQVDKIDAEELIVDEFTYNKVSVLNGDQYYTDNGVIEGVEAVDGQPLQRTITISDKEGGASTFKLDDLLFGIYLDFPGGGLVYRFVKMIVLEVIEPYVLRVSLTADSADPTQQMIVVRRGNRTNPERQRFKYFRVNPIGEFWLVNVSDFDFDESNILSAKGDLRQYDFGAEFNQFTRTAPYSQYDRMSKVLEGYFMQRSGSGLYAPIPADRGSWLGIVPDAQGLRVCYHYDRVSHGGSLWDCAVSETSAEPSEATTDWTRRTDKGESVIPGGVWSHLNAPYKANSMVSFARASFMAKRETSVPPVGLLLSGGKYLLSGGRYLLRGNPADYVNTDDWMMVTPPPVDGTDGDDGEDAPLLKAQYSAEGVSGWHDTYVSTDRYRRDSNDGGVSWSGAMRITGNDGLPGALPVTRQWVAGETYRRDETTVDYALYKATETSPGSWWRLKAGYVAVVAGVSPYDSEAFEPVSSYEAIATNVLLAEDANIAGFIFKENKMLSRTKNNRGEYNLAIDGINGQITALKGRIGGLMIEGNSLSNENDNNDAAIRMRNSASGTRVDIGGNVQAASTGGVTLGRFENTKYDSSGFHTGLYLNVTGGAVNNAIQVVGGDIHMSGSGNFKMTGYGSLEMSGSGSATLKNLTAQGFATSAKWLYDSDFGSYGYAIGAEEVWLGCMNTIQRSIFLPYSSVRYDGQVVFIRNLGLSDVLIKGNGTPIRAGGNDQSEYNLRGVGIEAKLVYSGGYWHLSRFEV